MINTSVMISINPIVVCQSYGDMSPLSINKIAASDANQAFGASSNVSCSMVGAQALSNSRVCFVAGNDEVVVDILQSDSAYQNQLFWSIDNFVTKHFIGVDNDLKSVNLGKFAVGTNIEFAIENGAEVFFRTGDASLNHDRMVHAKVIDTDLGTEIGFEDLRGGGDQDFNDAVIKVRHLASEPMPEESVRASLNVPVAMPMSQSIASVEPKLSANLELSDNRSGLADGSNPGGASDKNRSDNSGTLNRSNQEAVFAKTLVLAKPVLDSRSLMSLESDRSAGLPVSTASADLVCAESNGSNRLTLEQVSSEADFAKTMVLFKPLSVSADATKEQVSVEHASSLPNKTTNLANVVGNDNRSGLADGSNPGLVSDKNRSDNNGTFNPSNQEADFAKTMMLFKPLSVSADATKELASVEPLVNLQQQVGGLVDSLAGFASIDQAATSVTSSLAPAALAAGEVAASMSNISESLKQFNADGNPLLATNSMAVNAQNPLGRINSMSTIVTRASVLASGS